ncbi:MAG: tetratricopeptide repeat protein [Flavobacteriaceae bacterium]
MKIKDFPVFRTQFNVTVCFLFFCVFASAQKTFTPEQFDQKISDCNSLTEQNLEEAVLCFNKLLPLLEQADYEKGIINYYAYVSYIYISQGKIQEAVDLVYEGKEKHFDKLVDENMRMFFVMLEIRVLERQEKYLEVLSLIEKIMPEVTINQQKAYLYTTRGVNYQRLGEYEKALSDQYEALKLYKSIQETENVITIYNRLGLLNNELQDPQKELSFYEKALKLAQDTEDEEGLQMVYNNLAIFYKQTDSLNKALEYYEKSRELAKKYNSPIDFAMLLFNIGDVYAETGKTRQAIDNFNQSLAISKEFGVPQGIMYNYLGLGKVYTKTGEYSISKTNYDSLMVYAKRFERPNMEGATQDFDFGIDAKLFGYSGSALYSLIENNQDNFVIQGRALPFDDNDVVSLGFRANEAGSYTISLADFDGIFAEGQDIFIKDNLTQTEQNLKNGNYSFVSEQGIFNTRFEVVYKQSGTLDIINPDLNNSWIIYKQNNVFHIFSEGFEMSKVTVYDMLGRKVYTSQASGNSHIISHITANQVLIVKVTTSENEVLSKKVSN